MARPKQVAAREPLTLSEIAAATYVGSKEHKATRWWDGLPAAYVGPAGIAARPKKQMTTVCPLTAEAERREATGWLHEALKHQQYRFYEGDKLYPKHVWYKDETGRYWFGFCINSIAGTYKGWPIDKAEKRETFG